MSDQSAWLRSVRGALPPRTDLLALAIAIPAVALICVVPVAIGTAEYGRVATLAAIALVPALVVHRWPRAALAATVLAESAHLLSMDLGAALPEGVDLSIALIQPVPVATALVAGLAIPRLSRRDAWLAPLLAALTLAGVSFAATGMADIGTAVLLFDVVLMGAGVGWLVRASRERRARREAERAEHAEHAVAEERLRIARDLHDVLAHQLTLINAQAGVVEYLLDSDPVAARAALSGIARHTAAALEEVRSTVGMMRMAPDDAPDQRSPLPTLAHLPMLIESCNAAGTRATLEVDGTPRSLSEQAGLAMYRIVQESLTNAAKHAPGAPVAVEVTWWLDTLEVRVENQPPHRIVHGNGTGAGLIGMAERARALGGTLECAATPRGGYAVVARIPCPSVDPQRTEHPA